MTSTNIDGTRVILVVDDAPINIGVVLQSLSAHGYTVLVAHDGVEAVERAEFSRPNLILLDVRMPGIDGFETCRRLKLMATTRDIPVVFMTSLTETKDIVEGFAVGGVDYLTKPVRIPELLTRINTHLELSNMRNLLIKQNEVLSRHIGMRKQAEQALTIARRELEIRVEQRTSELAKANSGLEAEIACRKLAEAKLQSSETRFRLIVEASPTPLCITSLSLGQIHFMNVPFRRLFALGLTGNANSNIADLYVDKEAFERLLVLLHNSGGFVNEEVHLKAGTNATVWALATAQVARFDDEPVICFGFIDVTARKHAEEKLRTSEASLANAQRLAKLGDWEWHAGVGTIHWSEQMYQILGLTQHADKSGYRTLVRSVHPDDRASIRGAVRAMLGGRKQYTIDCRVIGADGQLLTVQFQAEGTISSEHSSLELTGTIQDITELKRIEHELVASRQQLRELSAYMEGVREQERKRIAMEVHDELGQLLTALKMDVALLKMQVGVQTDAARKADDMRELVEKTLWMVRNVASHLRPAALNFGIVSALEWLVEDFGRRNLVKGQFSVTGGEPDLPDSQATAIFRIAQASLTNVARHAGASRIDVVLNHVEDSLLLYISDDGCGFDHVEARKGYSYGLLGMSERARLIGASLKIESTIGIGTVISIYVPLEDPRPE